jgi:hypothetical protein
MNQVCAALLHPVPTDPYLRKNCVIINPLIKKELFHMMKTGPELPLHLTDTHTRNEWRLYERRVYP